MKTAWTKTEMQVELAGEKKTHVEKKLKSASQAIEKLAFLLKNF